MGDDKGRGKDESGKRRVESFSQSAEFTERASQSGLFCIDRTAQFTYVFFHDAPPFDTIITYSGFFLRGTQIMC